MRHHQNKKGYYYQSTDDDIMSPSASTTRPVTWYLWPCSVCTHCPLFKSQISTRASIPPDTIPPSGKSSLGDIHAKGPTKLECPTRVFDNIYFLLSCASKVQNLTVVSRDEVAIPLLPHESILRTLFEKIENDFNF